MNIRKSYLTATTLDQDILDRCAQELTNRLELVVDIELPRSNPADSVEYLYASDRNKYVGSTFYKALLNIPTVHRTLGEWLSGVPEFSSLELELNNATGEINNYVPGGSDYGGWVGNEIVVKIGLRDVASTFLTIFRGFVTEVGGFNRRTKSIILIVRDQFHKVTQNFPLTAFTVDTFPNIESAVEGLAIPVVGGDWATNTSQNAEIPSFVTNGLDPVVTGGGPIICMHSITTGSFNTSQVYIRRGSVFQAVPAPNILSLDNGRQVRITQGFTFDGGWYQYQQGDQFFVAFVADALEGSQTNAVAFAKYLLKTYGGLVDADFDARWTIALSDPDVNAIYARFWVQESQSVIEYAKSLCQQVNMEIYLSKLLKFSLNPMWFNKWNNDPDIKIKNWDVERDSFEPKISEVNNFNRAQAVYNFMPSLGDELNQTAWWRNDPAITQDQKEISKRIVFPNLYIETHVETVLKEVLKLSSATVELIDCNLTWRLLLIDVGEFVKLNVQIGGTVYDNVRCMVRSLGYNPNAVRIPVQLMSFQMCPYNGYNPNNPGTVGGYLAVLTKEIT